MESVEDSGIDSDQKLSTNDQLSDEHNENIERQSSKESLQNKNFNYRKSSELQNKLQDQRHVHRSSHKPGSLKLQSKRSHILPRSRLKVPLKHYSPEFSPLSQEDISPLIEILSDSEEDEFESPFIPKAQQAIRQQLLKDGYNLDKTADDEDLDLIPPRPLHQRPVCCHMQISCVIL